MSCTVRCATGVASIHYESSDGTEIGTITTGSSRGLSDNKYFSFSVSVASGYSGYYITGITKAGGTVSLSSFPSNLKNYSSLTVGGVAGGGGGGGASSKTVKITTGEGLNRVNFQVYRDANIISAGTIANGSTKSFTYPSYDAYGQEFLLRVWVESADYVSGYGEPCYGVGLYDFTSNVTKTVYATRTATYTVTFNKNTSDGVSNMPSNITNAYGTKTIPSNVPRRNGYSFDYWYTQYDVRYLPSSNIDVYENITLYAHWTQSTYYLYFDANTSDNVSNIPTTISRVGTGNVTIPNIVPLRDNYQFTGWASGGVTYQPTDIFNLTANTTLYAQWQRVYTHTITYDANGGTLSTYGATTTKDFDYQGTTSSFPIQIKTGSELGAVRNGYTFSSWNDVASGTGQTFIGGNSYSFSGNYKLYAQWSARTYTVTINPNGGYIGGSASSINVSQNYGETFSFSPYLPTRQYYDFEGWLSSGGVNKGGNDSYVVSGNETWTAQWSDIHSYKLTLYANYSGAPHVSSEITRTGGSQINLSDYSDNFVRDGYKLMGWAHDPNATAGSVDYAVDGVVTLSTNITLYAIWLKTYTVSYYSQGRLFATDYGDFIATTDNQGSGSGYLPNAYADVISLIPTWVDHDFKGWANSSSATTPDYTSGQSHAIPVSGNVTLYAVWQWQRIDPFYWTGTYSGDLAAFQTGLPVSDAITAAGWNNLITKIDALIQRAGLSVSTAKPSYATSGMSIMASLYNAMRGYIIAVLLQMNIGAAYFPPTVSTGDEITPYHFAFEGTNSLQGAVNHAISVFNNSLN